MRYRRSYGYGYYSNVARYPLGAQIESPDGHTLYVENREYYSDYRLEDGYGRIILEHSVRSMEPLPVRPAQIIHARHIPWFMWLWYGVRNWWRRWQWDRRMKEAAVKDDSRRAAIRQAVKDRGLGRFGGRYNR